MWRELLAMLLAFFVGIGSVSPSFVKDASSFFSKAQDAETESAEKDSPDTHSAGSGSFFGGPQEPETKAAEAGADGKQPGAEPAVPSATDSVSKKEQDVYSGAFRFKAPENWIQEDFEDGSLYLWINEKKGVYIYLDTYYLNGEKKSSKAYFDELEKTIYGEDNYGISTMTGKTRDYKLNGVDVRRMFSTFYSVTADTKYYTEDILMIGANQLTYLIFECMPEDYFEFHQEYESFLTSLEILEPVG